MPTPAYTEFDSNTPQGGNDPTYFSAELLENLRALRDSAVMGRVAGFLQSRTQGTGPDVARPQYLLWIHATLLIGFRLKLVWGGTGNWQITSCEWEWTNDNGSSWASLGTAQANTWDANDNITGTTNSGGQFTLLQEIWTKVLKLSGTLGTMALQNADNVAITGGTINGVPVADIGSSAGATMYEYENFGGF